MAKTTEQEIGSEQRAQALQVRKDAELFRSLMAHSGWPRYLAMIEAVGNNYQKTLMTPLNTSFESVKTEFAKGALTGLSLAAQLPSLKIKEAAELSSKPDTDDEKD